MAVTKKSKLHHSLPCCTRGADSAEMCRGGFAHISKSAGCVVLNSALPLQVTYGENKQQHSCN